MNHNPNPTTLDWGRDNGPGPQTESSRERGYPVDPDIELRSGASDELDPDGVGDIADEGRGHRG